MENLKSTKKLYEKLILLPDLHSKPEFNGEIIIWKLYKNAFVRAWCDERDICIDIVSNSTLIGSIYHWHPDEDDFLDNLYSLGKKGNILVIRNLLFFQSIFYKGELCNYNFSKNKKWCWGKLTYLYQCD